MTHVSTQCISTEARNRDGMHRETLSAYTKGDRDGTKWKKAFGLELQHQLFPRSPTSPPCRFCTCQSPYLPSHSLLANTHTHTLSLSLSLSLSLTLIGSFFQETLDWYTPQVWRSIVLTWLDFSFVFLICPNLYFLSSIFNITYCIPCNYVSQFISSGIKRL